MSWRNRRHSTLQLLASSAAVVGLSSLLLTPGLANAAPPERQPVLLTDFVLKDAPQPEGKDPCGFEVHVHVVKNGEILTSFTQSGVSLITGALKVRLTRLTTLGGATTSTIERNISGPTFVTENADGSVTQRTAGPGLWAFEPGKAPDLPRAAITTGRTESVFSPQGDFSFISLQGIVEDVCAALAP
jgi:hypothetical protein